QRGSALYFVAGSAIMSSTLTTHPELRAGVPRVIVNDPLLVPGGAANKPFDVAPDGRILAIKEDASVRPDHIVVVQNWLSDVRARNADSLFFNDSRTTEKRSSPEFRSALCCQ